MVKRIPEGADIYGTSEGYEDPKTARVMEDEEEYQGIDFSNTSADLFQQLVRYMRTKGIKALSIPGGSWAGFELYVLDTFNVPELQVPKEFRYWRTLRTHEEKDRLIVKEAIQGCASIECQGGADKKTQSRWLGFVEAWSAYMASEQTTLWQIANGMKTTAPYRTRTFRGTSGHHVVVPPAEWFPQCVRDVSVYDLLSIMPSAEADMLMLNLGRAVVGYSGQESGEGLVEHDYRYFCGLVGGANLGKSTLVEKFIKPALQLIGCKVDTWNLRQNNPFGWARRACSDVYFLSDVLTKDTVNVIGDPQQKILASGEAITTEEKGKGDVIIERPSAGGFLFLANGLDVSRLQIMDDDGVSDRFKALMCRERAELKELYGQEPDTEDPTALRGMTGLYWNRLAKDLGVSTQVLALWLLSQSADRFLSACGYSFQDNYLVQSAVPSLKTRVAEISSQLRMSNTIKSKEELIDAIKYGVAYYVMNMGESDKEAVLSHLDELEFNHQVLLTALNITCFTPWGTYPEWTQCFKIKSLAVGTCRPFIEKNSKTLETLHHCKEPASAFEYVTRFMKTTKNMFGYPTHPVSYSNLWRSALIEIPLIVKSLEADKEKRVGKDLRGYIQGYRAIIDPLIFKYA